MLDILPDTGLLETQFLLSDHSVYGRIRQVNKIPCSSVGFHGNPEAGNVTQPGMGVDTRKKRESESHFPTQVA